VVGDDDQSIYKFRGASVSNILQFKKDYPQAEQIFLINNYRNKQNILDLSYKFIKQNDPNRLEYQLNKKTKKPESTPLRQGFEGQAKIELSKKLVADNKGEGVIEIIEGKDLNEEIRLIIEKIADLKIKDKNSTWDDFAILVRANESAKEICSFLSAAELPYQFLSSRGLYTKPVIMDLIAYLKLLDDYHESIAAYRILNLPIFKFTYNELVNFNYWAGKKAWSLFEVLQNVSALNLGMEVWKKAEAVLSLIAKHTGLTRDKNAGEIILAFLNDSGYLKYLTGQDEQKSREVAGCLNQFMRRVEEFEKNSDDKSVKAFLNQLQMEIDAGEEGAMPVDWEAGPETIKVMTVHGAKGLEFKYVFIAGLVDKRFPTIERSEQIEIPDALVKEILPEGDIHLEEERRLFYVAMTRAKDELYFSWAADYGGARLKKPSRFLEECGLVRENTKTLKHKNTKTLERNILEPKKVDFKKDETINISIPSYFSYTQLAAFSNCPYQYRFAHILRIPVRGKHVFSFGKTLHITLQKLFSLIGERKKREQTDLFGSSADSTQATKKNVKISLEEILKLYEQSWIDDWYENKAEKEKYKKKGKEILKQFYEKHQDNWPDVIFLEKGFNSKIRVGNELYTVRGVMDRIDEAAGHRQGGAGKIRIVDYKTGNPKEKLSLDEKYQLLIYQLAAEELFRQKIDCLIFYYLDNNTEVKFLGSQEELDKTKEKIVNTIAAIKKGEFPPKPSALCQFCDFKNICEFRKT
jgi:DNA helicase II / ATP-dependent DNA helicase PcrA